jgi:nucleoside-diphosphate-sugar epimerase
MKILVTGATGFIGRAFCHEAIQRGHQILALTRDPAVQIVPEVQIAAGSLADTPWEQVAAFAPDAALHLAWIAEPGVYLNSPENELWLEQSKTWLRRLIEIGVPYLAGTGTCIEYAPSNEPLHETTSRIEPAFPYSRAKAALFQWLQHECEESAINWNWFRVFYPYGPGEHHHRICSSLINQLRAGRSLTLRTPDSTKDYIFIEDAARALCQTIEARLSGAVNVGTGQGVSIKSLATRVAYLLQADASLVQQAAQIDHDPSPVVLADNRLLQSIGWKQQISLDDGLQRLIDSFQEAA